MAIISGSGDGLDRATDIIDPLFEVLTEPHPEHLLEPILVLVLIANSSMKMILSWWATTSECFDRS